VTSFREFRQQNGPGWLVNPDTEGGLVGYSLDLLKDAFLERLELGLLASYPQNGPNGETAPDDALTAIGRERKIPRGINETSTAYALRLLDWLDDARAKGSAFMLLKQLRGYLNTPMMLRTVDNRGNCYTRDASDVETYVAGTPGDWNWDNQPNKWSRFWVILYPPATLWTQPNPTLDWGTHPAWGTAGTTWGSTATPEQVATVKWIVNEWKPAGTRCVNIIVAFDPASFTPGAFEPDGTWGDPGVIVDGVLVPSRLQTAIYWDGR
jgi:hypothetical protein